MRSAPTIILAIAYALAAGPGCKREATLPLEVEYAGCAKVLVGPVCGLGEKRELRFWLRALPSDKIRASAGGETLAITPEEIADGVGFGVRVPEGAKELALELTTEAGKGTWRLAVTSTSVPAVIVAAESLWRQGKGTQAEADLQVAMPNMSTEEQAAATSLLGRIALAAGRSDEAVKRLGEAMESYQKIGCLSCRAMDGLVMIYSFIHHGRFLKKAREVMDGLASSTYLGSETSILVSYNQGLLAFESGDLRSALRAFQSSLDGATRVGMERERRMIAQMLAVVWQALGDEDAAVKVLTSIRSAIDISGSACERAAFLNNISWLYLLRSERVLTTKDMMDPEVFHQLETALHLYERECPLPAEAANTLVNLALAALRVGDLVRARQYLTESDTRLPQPEPRLRLWKLDIAGRIALANDRPHEAAVLFSDLEQLGERAEAINACWRAAQGQAYAFTELRQYEKALAAYERAESFLDEAARRVALGDGRDTFLGLHARGTGSYIRLLMEQGKTTNAAMVARRSRRRIIASVARIDRLATLPHELRTKWEEAVAGYQRDRAQLENLAASEWKLTGEALRLAQKRHHEQQAALRRMLDDALAILDGESPFAIPQQEPSEGELILLFYPLDIEWIAFAIESNTIKASIVLKNTIAISPAQLFASFDEQISRAKKIRIITTGKTDVIDFHALSWRGVPLLAHASIAYALDIDASTEAMLSRGMVRAAVLADPTGNLPAARREAEDVATSLVSKRWQVNRLLGDEAQLQSVRQVMEASQLVHFAGHGQSAQRGLSAALELAQGELTAGDILALPRVPPVVVLAACDSARASGDGPVVGIGLAHAFIAAGSGAAVAARRRVDDHLTHALMRAFYRRLDNLDGWSVAEALRAAQLERYHADPTSDWAAFRVLLP